MDDRTPHQLPQKPVRTRWLVLPWWLAAILKGREAWQDRQLRRNYEGPEARKAREAREAEDALYR